jgi:hypothetical protein
MSGNLRSSIFASQFSSIARLLNRFTAVSPHGSTNRRQVPALLLSCDYPFLLIIESVPSEQMQTSPDLHFPPSLEQHRY